MLSHGGPTASPSPGYCSNFSAPKVFVIGYHKEKILWKELQKMSFEKHLTFLQENSCFEIFCYDNLTKLRVEIEIQNFV